MHATMESRPIGTASPGFAATALVDEPETIEVGAGFISPYFITDPDTREAVLESPLILLLSRPIASRLELLPLLRRVVRAGRSLLVIADGVEGEALATLVVNKISGVLPSVAVTLPTSGQGRTTLVELARDCGAHPSSLEGFPLELLSLRDLGQAARVIVTSERTTITISPAVRREARQRALTDGSALGVGEIPERSKGIPC